MLQGHTNQHALASRFGVGPTQIAKDMEFIWAAWFSAGPNGIEERRGARVKALEYVIQLASTGYHKSKLDSEKSFVSNSICGKCNGRGVLDGDFCEQCKGNGFVPTESSLTVMAGKPGDPAFLRVITDAIREINRVEGNYSPVKHRMKVDGRIDGRIEIVADDFLNAPADILLAARAAITRLRESSGSPPVVVDGRIVSDTGTE